MSSPKPKISQEQLQIEYERFQDTIKSINEKITELKNDYDEHKIVVATLKGVPADRKCFRMISGVIVKKTTREVIPVLETKIESMVGALDTLSKELVKTHQEFEKWKKNTGVKIVSTA
ncbi:tubulin-binding prefolding complex subunit GIM4 [Ascoidea rubescens DSM 1968]|uniref:Prefoldin beta-like protein n=1 Tax=Ascoidea rubescens DSM 1968 TaxID=1344418 RepID=A0A1D2VC81_9ASCO|nr:Prefoldin beta-like protein [Ascoidea rubescens DSM 1968]ODV59097.1 Prefoldin beta-like protein [Ascoidea rubescens DSM 1968]